MTAEQVKKSDLGVRTLSAIGMVAVAIGAFWAGGWILAVFIGMVALGLLWEYWGLVRLLSKSRGEILVWMTFGLLYIGLAVFMILVLNSPFYGPKVILTVIGSVVATDIGAYFAGRTFGGPKIAPRISPSKTWSGLVGGMIGAAIVMALFSIPAIDASDPDATISAALLRSLLIGSAIAVVAQAGDFFESWMKRRAGVKDSGNLIPGHGGLFDRTDGLIAVLFVTGLLFFGSAAFA